MRDNPTVSASFALDVNQAFASGVNDEASQIAGYPFATEFFCHCRTSVTVAKKVGNQIAFVGRCFNNDKLSSKVLSNNISPIPEILILLRKFDSCSLNRTNITLASKRRIRFAIFCLYFCTGICFSSWASRIPDIKNTLGLDDAAWGTILLMIPVGQICGMTISGLIISKIGSKKILPLALVGYVAALLLIGLSSTGYALIMSLIVFGFSGNFCNISVNTQAISLEAVCNKPIMASFHGGWSLAGLTGASIGLLMASIHVLPIYHFGTVGAIVIITLILNRPYLQPDIKKEKDPADVAARKRRKPESFLFLLGIVAFCGMAAEGSMSDWSGLYLIDVVGKPKHLAPLGLAAYMITMASGRFMIDKATQKWGRQRIIQAGGILISTGLFTAVAFPNFITVIIAFMITGFGTAGIVPTLYSTAGQKTRIPASLALTIVSSVSFLGFLMGPPLIGYIASVTNLRYSYGFIGMLGICIVILASTIKIFSAKNA